MYNNITQTRCRMRAVRQGSSSNPKIASAMMSGGHGWGRGEENTFYGLCREGGC